MKTKSQLIDEYISFLSGKLVEKKYVGKPNRPHLRFWVSETQHVVHHFSLNSCDFLVHRTFMSDIGDMFELTKTEIDIHLLKWAEEHLKIIPNEISPAAPYTLDLKFTDII